MWHTYGHDQVKKILESQLKNKAFPHAYLFFGPDGIGKKTLALEFAARILGAGEGAEGKAEGHPDFSLLDCFNEPPVQQVRDFISRLGYKPFVSDKKVAVINDAQNLNIQSSNALLKTIEEPTPGTVIILVSSGRLLPTIVSRCLVLNFNLFSRRQMSMYAPGVQNRMAGLSFGSVARLQKMLSDTAYADGQEKTVDLYKRLRSASMAERLAEIPRLAAGEPEDLQESLMAWYRWQAQELEAEPGRWRLLEALGEAVSQARSNKNKKMILQGLFLKL